MDLDVHLFFLASLVGNIFFVDLLKLLQSLNLSALFLEHEFLLFLMSLYLLLFDLQLNPLSLLEPQLPDALLFDLNLLFNDLPLGLFILLVLSGQLLLALFLQDLILLLSNLDSFLLLIHHLLQFDLVFLHLSQQLLSLLFLFLDGLELDLVKVSLLLDSLLPLLFDLKLLLLLDFLRFDLVDLDLVFDSLSLHLECELSLHRTVLQLLLDLLLLLFGRLQKFGLLLFVLLLQLLLTVVELF